MCSRRLVAFVVVVLASVPIGAELGAARAQEVPGGSDAAAGTVPSLHGKPCGLFVTGAKAAASTGCLECHSAGGGAAPMEHSHPVGIEYGNSRARRPSDFRPSAEVARRGIGVPNGKVECVTCHDAGSKWAARVVLPNGVVAMARSDPRSSDAGASSRNWRIPDPRRTPPPPGSVVVSAPLCAACHTLAD